MAQAGRWIFLIESIKQFIITVNSLINVYAFGRENLVSGGTLPGGEGEGRGTREKVENVWQKQN